MFGGGFESKVRAVLQEQFSYRPGSYQKPILTQIVKQARAHGGNEFDAAIFFMLVQMNALLGDDPSVKDFVRTHTDNVRRVMGVARADPDDINPMLEEIAAKHGLTVNTSKSNDVVAQSFEDWLWRFKVECGKHKQGLTPDRNGSSLVDFMDLEPLRRAYRDRQSPEEIGKAFALQFDINTFRRP